MKAKKHESTPDTYYQIQTRYVDASAPKMI